MCNNICNKYINNKLLNLASAHAWFLEIFVCVCVRALCVRVCVCLFVCLSVRPPPDY